MFLLLTVSKISFEQLEQGNNRPVLGFLPSVSSEDNNEEVIDINGSGIVPLREEKHFNVLV